MSNALLGFVIRGCWLAFLWLPAMAQVPAPLQQPSFPLITNGTVLAMARAPDGGIFLGGEFTSINGIARSNIARLRADGSLDPDWNPGTDGSVMALAAGASGAVFAGGSFEHAGGTSVRYLVKFAGVAGNVDPQWNPQADQAVFALAIGADDALYAGGRFEGFGPIARRHIAKLSTTGTGALDPLWDPGTDSFVTLLATSGDDVYAGGDFATIGGQPRAYLAKLSGSSGSVVEDWDPSPLYLPLALAIGTDGDIYVGGPDFVTIGGQSRQYIARLSPTSGLASPTWNPVLDGPVTAIAFDESGHVFIGGNFVSVAGLPRLHLARLSPDGAGDPDPAWTTGVDDSGMLTASWGFVRALAMTTDQLFVGGPFTLAGGETRLGLAGIDASGSILAPIDVGHLGSAYVIAAQPGGGKIVGGEFYLAGSTPRRHLLRLLPDGSLDPEWNPAADRPVYALATTNDQSVYAGGQFFHIGGLDRAGIAKLSGASGAGDPNWNTLTGGDYNFNVYALALGTDGSVYAGGYFFFTLDGNSRRFLSKYQGSTGALDPDWDPSPDGAVFALALGPNSALYAGGAFQAIGGLAMNYAAKIDGLGLGAVDAGWNLGLDGPVTALIADAENSIYLGGQFGDAGGQLHSGLARASLATPAIVDAGWIPWIVGNVRAMTLVRGSALIVGGDTCSNCEPLAFLERIALTGDGTPDPLWSPQPDAPVLALGMGNGGAVLVGGDFTSIGGAVRGAIAALPDGGSGIIFADGFDD